jgi:hypothetical protein
MPSVSKSEEKRKLLRSLNKIVGNKIVTGIETSSVPQKEDAKIPMENSSISEDAKIPMENSSISKTAKSMNVRIRGKKNYPLQIC